MHRLLVADAVDRLASAKVRACPIWIAPKWVVETVGATRLGAVEWIARATEAGVGSLLLIAKQCDGRCIWPTQLPALGTNDDFFGAVCREAGPRKLQIYAYYSVALDSYRRV
jgi:hypothetical protein